MILSDNYIIEREKIRKFVDEEIIPLAEYHDREEKLHPKVISEMKERGYLGCVIPNEYNGLGMDQISLAILNEEIGRGCSSTRSLLTVHGMVSLAILKWGTIAQKETWLPKLAIGELIGAFALTEPNVGSDAKNIEMTAVEEWDSFVISGKKKWITFGQIADLFLVFAQVDGKPSAFLVERDSLGVSVKPMSGLLGARASMIAEITFEDVRIPKENIIGKVGTGLSHIALTCLDYGRYTIALGCVGLGQACLENSVNYSRERIQFGAPLHKNQLIKKMITEMTVNLKAARLLCYNAGHLKEIGDPDSIMETWSAKYFASRAVMKIASDAVQIHGANGCSNQYPVERYYRDAKINEIIEGTTQIHELLISADTIRTV
ncbi:acyl-CoA dehydrogenase family protein [Lysinibacillus sp. NPDC058147]|uniref:acyl-CoA dehydrogenase family protein n=1 Tax=unclassified Lysinibacillus TaxID=2636778 RepID=UPI0036DBA640